MKEFFMRRQNKSVETHTHLSSWCTCSFHLIKAEVIFIIWKACSMAGSIQNLKIQGIMAVNKLLFYSRITVFRWRRGNDMKLQSWPLSLKVMCSWNFAWSFYAYYIKRIVINLKCHRLGNLMFSWQGVHYWKTVSWFVQRLSPFCFSGQG